MTTTDNTQPDLPADDNTQAVKYTLTTTSQKSKDPDVEVLEGKQNLYFHNKKTGYGYFIHFDQYEVSLQLSL